MLKLVMSKNEGTDKNIVGLKDNTTFYKGLLRFILGYCLTSFIHLINMMDEIGGDFYSFMIDDSLVQSIPEGLIVGIIFVYHKKILNFKIKK